MYAATVADQGHKSGRGRRCRTGQSVFFFLQGHNAQQFAVIHLLRDSFPSLSSDLTVLQTLPRCIVYGYLSNACAGFVMLLTILFTIGMALLSLALLVK